MPAHGCAVRLPEIPVGQAEVAEDRALALPVVSLTEDRQRLLAARDGLLEPPLFPVGLAEVVQGLAFAVPVAGLPPGRQCVPVAGDSFLEPLALSALAGAANIPSVSIAGAVIAWRSGNRTAIRIDAAAPIINGVQTVPGCFSTSQSACGS